MSSDKIGKRRPGWNTANPSTYARTRPFQKQLRANQTQAERKLWSQLKNKQLGHKFRRQHIIDVFIVDFVCLSKQLIIEVDGQIHEYAKQKDQQRTSILNQQGFKVIRFTNEEVRHNLNKVLLKIQDELR
jgi:very-short-patch-repair endonuclease